MTADTGRRATVAGSAGDKAKRDGRSRTIRTVRGDDLLYRFFNDTVREHPDRFGDLPLLVLRTMAIWMPLDVYANWPILLPWVVRDPGCRGNRSADKPDEWSSPNADGYLRDDNSLIKSVPRSLTVRGPSTSHMRGARMGPEFVAAHVWRVVTGEKLASRLPQLNSFVPNLVWLPAQIAKLTDREGGAFQRALQDLAWSLYRDAPVAEHLIPLVEGAWGLLPSPGEVAVFDGEDLNWFESSERFFTTRAARLASVVSALRALDSGDELPIRVVTRRYASGLPAVEADRRKALMRHLLRFQAGG